MHGDLEQRERDQMLVRFSNRSADILVATDVAARGLDIDDLAAVINYDLTRDPEIHIHRIGRTGRAGMQGVAISLMGGDERRNIAAIEKLIQQQIFVAAIPYIDGENTFEYDAEIIASASSIQPQKITRVSGIGKRGKSSKPGSKSGKPRS